MTELDRASLWRWVRSMVAKRVAPADVDDVTQEVALAACCGFHRYDPTYRITTWLRSIINCVVINHHRTQDGHPGRCFRPGMAVRPTTEVLSFGSVQHREPDPLDAAIVSEHIERVRAAVEGLPPHQRRSLRQHMDGVPLRTIAARSRRTRQAITSRMRLARGWLRNELKECE